MKKNTKILIVNWEVNFARRDEEIFKELGYDVEYFKVHQRDIFNPKIFWKLYKKAKEADILFSWWATNFVTVFLSKITGTPSIIVAGGSAIETDPILLKLDEWSTYNKFSWKLKTLVKFTTRFTDKILLVSNHTRKYNYYNIVGKDPNDEVVYNCIDTKIFKPKKTKKENYIVTTGYMAKSYVEKKGYLKLLEAFNKISKKYPTYKLIYLGDVQKGEKDGRLVLKEKAKEYGVVNKIIFKEFPKDKKKYVDFLNSCKIYVHYSMCDSFAVAMVEAMACGIPIIASDVMALPEVVGDAGLIADRENTSDLAEKIEMLINDERLINKLSRKGVERVRNNFSKEIRKQKLKKIVEGIKNE